MVGLGSRLPANTEARLHLGSRIKDTITSSPIRRESRRKVEVVRPRMQVRVYVSSLYISLSKTKWVSSKCAAAPNASICKMLLKQDLPTRQMKRAASSYQRRAWRARHLQAMVPSKRMPTTAIKHGQQPSHVVTQCSLLPV